ncbi:hypothetical protein PROSTU_01458 [Providencia stuartii ATCC 25827]|uniref:Uncharacterized protein n=1 Tax=Providencia stuartii ATCC 25827 TaxID=471874 RepID=A0AA87CPV2_PROST|nr:hypothetical protein PROSTU_01458 [Providencia stuartii ATCC 25827]
MYIQQNVNLFILKINHLNVESHKNNTFLICILFLLAIFLINTP